MLSCLAILLGGCASTQYVESERDPWQGWNRTVYGFNDTMDRAILKPAGLLTRDPRMVERKKFGQKKARKKFQFSKR